MSHKRNSDKKRKRDERLRAGQLLAAVAPPAPLDAILQPATPAPALTAAEQTARLEALQLFEIFEREIIAPLRQRFLRAALINSCRGLKEGLASVISEKK